MAQTPNLLLPYILAAQAQKHVTHNEAIRALDAIVQLSVFDRDQATPPANPVDGNRYIVAALPDGAWADHAGKIAAWQDGAWAFYTPLEGWTCWIADEDLLVAWDGSAWVTCASGGGSSVSLNPAAGGLVGVNATADTTNRLAVSSPASLFNHEGAGHQQKINKAAAGDTASQLYQTGFSGRAEVGLTGDDNFHFKVSADGVSWKDAILIDKASGAVSMPFTTLGGSGSPGAPQGRLTLASGVPVMAATVAGAGTVYYAPYIGVHAPLYDGATFSMRDIGGELSQATTDATKSPAACVASSAYDLFLWDDAGTIRCTRGPAWSSITARGTGAGTSELQRVAGVQLNKFAITNGPAANRGTWVGTIATNGSSLVDWMHGSTGAAASLGVWNAFNRVSVGVMLREGATNWTYGSATVRALNNTSTTRVSFVRGADEDAVDAMLQTYIDDNAGATAVFGFGLDTTTAHTVGMQVGFPGVAGIGSCSYRGNPGVGWHYLQQTESASGTYTAWGINPLHVFSAALRA